MKEVKPVQKQVAVELLKLVIIMGVDGYVSSCEVCLSPEIPLSILSTNS